MGLWNILFAAWVGEIRTPLWPGKHKGKAFFFFQNEITPFFFLSKGDYSFFFLSWEKLSYKRFLIFFFSSFLLRLSFSPISLSLFSKFPLVFFPLLLSLFSSVFRCGPSKSYSSHTKAFLSLFLFTSLLLRIFSLEMRPKLLEGQFCKKKKKKKTGNLHFFQDCQIYDPLTASGVSLTLAL